MVRCIWPRPSLLPVIYPPAHILFVCLNVLKRIWKTAIASSRQTCVPYNALVRLRVIMCWWQVILNTWFFSLSPPCVWCLLHICICSVLNSLPWFVWQIAQWLLYFKLQTRDIASVMTSMNKSRIVDVYEKDTDLYQLLKAAWPAKAVPGDAGTIIIACVKESLNTWTSFFWH